MTAGGTPGDPGGTPDELTPDEQRVRDWLRSAADVGPLPDDVAARVDAALREARADDAAAGAHGSRAVGSLADRRRSRARRLQRVFAAAAGVVVVAGAGGVLLLGHQQRTSDTSAGAGSSVAESATGLPATTQLLRSDEDYTDVAAVRGLGDDLAGASGDVARDSQGPDMLSAPGDEPVATAAPEERPAAERALACATDLGVDPAGVVAVEVATWQGTPAAFVVHRTDGDAGEVVVVAQDCTPGDAALSRVDVPLPPG